MIDRTPLIAVLIPSLSQRREQLIVLLRKLEQQQALLLQKVSILVHIDNRSMSAGAKRHELTRHAQQIGAKYVTCIDDDDDIDDYYLAKLCDACNDSPRADVVTFIAERTNVGDDKFRETWHFDLVENNSGKNEATGECAMSANHLCAWRTEIAVMSAWEPNIRYGDDQLWFGPLVGLHTAGVMRLHRRHIPHVLYHYKYDKRGTVNQRTEYVRDATRYFGHRGLRCYVNRGMQIYVEEGGGEHNAVITPAGCVRVRDCRNLALILEESVLRKYHTITLK